ncbi:MAG TPA: HAMP domain-containing sensor histidine kinase [Candidatus Nanoarchaeia archaeon]|nr:HAMP domain-containing sensor histidine kinase [Candidatus Nanoarchaeia archaeon]
MDAYTVDQLEAKRELVRRVRFYIKIRWFFLITLATVGLTTNFVVAGNNPTFVHGIWLTAVALGINGVFWAFSHRDGSLNYFRGLAGIQLLLDIALFSMAIYVDGGIGSRAISLYGIVLIITAALFEGWPVFVMAGLCTVGLVVAGLISSGQLVQQDISQIFFQAAVLFVEAYLIDTFFGFSRRREAERAHMSVISLASHQLRTPATAVKGLLSMLLDDESRLNVEDREIFMRAYNENERQLLLIGNLLEVARLDMDQLAANPQLVDLTLMIEESVTNMQPMAVKNSQKLTFTKPTQPAKVVADPEQIHMVLDNLVTNALNYSGRGSHVVVRLATEPGRVLLSVEDNGPGIARADQARLFERFTKLRYSHPQTTEGAGLGLYIVKKLIELNHGRIDLVSYPNEGTIFTVSLPTETYSA